MKIIFAMLLFVGCMNQSTCLGHAQILQIQVVSNNQLQGEAIIPRGEISELSKKLSEKTSLEALQKILPSYNSQNLLGDLLKGKFKYSPKEVLDKIVKIFLGKFLEQIKISIRIIAVIFVLGFVNFLKLSFCEDKVLRIINMCGYITVSIMAYNLVISSITEISNIVEKALELFNASFPILLTLMMFSGGISTSILLKPIYIFAVVFIFSCIKKVVIPLMIMQIAIAFASNLTQRYHLKSIGQTLRSLTLFLLGICLTVFGAILTLGGNLGYSIDNITAKTTKFAIGGMIPFAGKYISDASEVVLGSTMLLRNSCGIMVMIFVVCLCLVPVLKLLASAVIFKIVTIISRVVFEDGISTFLSEISSIFFTLSGIIATIVLVFYISICFIIGNSIFLK